MVGTQRFTDKVVIVTGGGNGIGLGITEAFLREGAKVLVGQRRTPASLLGRDRLFFKAADMGNPTSRLSWTLRRATSAGVTSS